MSKINLEVALSARAAKQGAREAESAFDRVARAARGGTKGSRDLENSFGRLRRQAQYLAGTLGVAFGGREIVQGMQESVRMAATYEGSLTRLETLVGISREQTEAWREEIQTLSSELGVSEKALSEAMFTITSGGARGSEALSILEQSAKAAAIGLGEARDIGRLAGAAVQAFGDQGLTASDAVDVLVATVREGNLEAAELAGALGSTMGTAAQLGVTFQDVGAFVATYTRLGVNAAEASTSLNAALSLAISPANEARAAMEEAGFSVDDFRSAIAEDGLTSALGQLVAATKGNLDTLGEFIPNLRALRGILGTAGVQGEEFAQIVENINNSVGITSEGFERFAEDAEYAFQRFTAAVESARIEWAERYLPAITRGVNWVTENLSNLEEAFAFGGQLAAGQYRSAFEGIAGYIRDAREEQDGLNDELERANQLSGERLQLLKGEIQASIAAREAEITRVTEETGGANATRPYTAQDSGQLKQWRAEIDRMQARLDAVNESLRNQIPVIEGITVEWDRQGDSIEDSNDALKDRVKHLTQGVALGTLTNEETQELLRLYQQLNRQYASGIRDLERRNDVAEMLADTAAGVVATWEGAAPVQQRLAQLENDSFERTRALFGEWVNIDQVLEGMPRRIEPLQGESESWFDTLTDGTVRWETAFISALGRIDDGVGGVAQSLAAALSQLPGTAGTVAGIAGGVIGILSSGAREAEIDQAAQRWESALERFVSSLDPGNTRFEQIIADAQNSAEDALSALIDSKLAGLDYIDRAAIEADLPRGFAGMSTEEQLESLADLDLFGSDAQQLLDAYREKMEQIEEQRQREIAVMESDVALLRMELEGREGAASLREIELEYQERINKARELGADHIATELEALQELALERERETQRIQEETEARRRARESRGTELELAEMEAAVAGDDRAVHRIQVQQSAEQRINRYQDQLDDGVIDPETFERLKAAVLELADQSLAEFDEALRESAAAAREAAAEERFRTAQEKQNLRVELLRLQGHDAAALDLQQMMRLEKARQEGKDHEYLTLLNLIAAEEDHALQLRDQASAQRTATRAVQQTASAVRGFAGDLNEPEGFRRSLLRWRASGVGVPGAASPWEPAGPATTAREASGASTSVPSWSIQGGLNLTLPGVTNAREFIPELEREVRRIMRAGGSNPLSPRLS